uniref:Tc1-like transposase DDE domain-containing protein n=2 Tax=Plectus sambesii TaxID=2011161 RepID=A0A914WNX6_9BILA
MRNKYATISEVDRQQTVEAYLFGQNASMIANVMGVKQMTINSIMSKFTKEGRVEAKQRGGKLLGYARRCCLFLHDQPNTEVFAYTIRWVLLQPVRCNDAAAIEERWLYAQTFLELFAQVSEAQIYFIDEVGFSVMMRARQGRSLRGTRAMQVAPGLQSRNISVCCAMNSQQVLHYLAKTRAFNREFSCTFLEGLFPMLAVQGVTNAVFVMDNVPFYKGNKYALLSKATAIAHSTFHPTPHFSTRLRTCSRNGRSTCAAKDRKTSRVYLT